MPNCITHRNDCREQKSYVVLFQCYFSCSASFVSTSSHLKICLKKVWLCFEIPLHTVTDFVSTAQGSTVNVMSCVRTSAFLHVFYVSYMFVIFCVVRTFVCMHICVCPCASVFSVCAWVRLFMSMFIVQNNDVFYMRHGRWKSHTLRYSLLLWISPVGAEAG